MLKAVVCVDRNFAIGKNNGLLFNLKTDLKHFKTVTLGHTVFMGYNTLLSLPGSKPLKNRTNIVLCPDGIEPENCIVFHKFDKALHYVKDNSINDDIFVIGGGMLYNSMLDYYDEVIVTKVDAEDPEATVFFPNLDTNKNFEIVSESENILDGEYNIKYITYKRIMNSKTKDELIAEYRDQIKQLKVEKAALIKELMLKKKELNTKEALNNEIDSLNDSLYRDPANTSKSIKLFAQHNIEIKKSRIGKKLNDFKQNQSSIDSKINTLKAAIRYLQTGNDQSDFPYNNFED